MINPEKGRFKNIAVLVNPNLIKPVGRPASRPPTIIFLIVGDNDRLGNRLSNPNREHSYQRSTGQSPMQKQRVYIYMRLIGQSVGVHKPYLCMFVQNRLTIWSTDKAFSSACRSTMRLTGKGPKTILKYILKSYLNFHLNTLKTLYKKKFMYSFF